MRYLPGPPPGVPPTVPPPPPIPAPPEPVPPDPAPLFDGDPELLPVEGVLVELGPPCFDPAGADGPCRPGAAVPWADVAVEDDCVELLVTAEPEVEEGPALVVAVLELVELLVCSLARIWSAWVMKLRQMIAGNVPPSTGWPL